MKFYLPLLMLPVLLLIGCSGRDQAAAEAVQGTRALATMAGTQEAQTVAAGATDYILATRGKGSVEELPAPQWNPQAIIDNAQGYADAGRSARDEMSGGFWALVGGGALAGVALLAGAVRTLGVGGPIAQLVASVVLSRTEKQTRKQREALADIAPVIIQAVETVNAQSVKELVSAELSGKDVLNAIIENLANQKKTPPV